MQKNVWIALSCAALTLAACDKVREHLPDQLARHLPGAEAPPPPPIPPPPAAAPAPVAAAPAPEVVKDLPAVPQVSLVDSLLAAGSVAANLLEPAQPGAAPLQAAAGQPGRSRAEKGLELLRSSGVQLADGAVRDEGERLVVTLEAADADKFEEELVTQWALGFAVLGALGAGEVAVVTAVDGTPMVEIAASAKDIAELAAEAIDTGEFFRRARFKRLGPPGEVEQELEVQGEIPVAEEEETAAKPVRPAAKVHRAPASGRAPMNRAPSSGRAAGAGAPYQRANSGRAPR